MTLTADLDDAKADLGRRLGEDIVTALAREPVVRLEGQADKLLGG